MAPWWVGNSKESYASGLANLATALDNWNKSRKGQRGGRRVGFPRFKSKRHRASCRFTTGAFGLSDQDRRHVKLPRIGLVRTHESTRKLARHVERGTARIATLHTRVANARRNGLHKLSPRLVDEFDTVVVEDLNVAGMTRNHRLARHISDVGMGELRRQLDYKTGWNSRALVVADRWYPSSKTCNDCGAVKTKLRLNQRVFTCDHCGHAADRDLNAARNLAGLASPHS